MTSATCPKCGRTLPESGTVTIGDSEFPVYQCDECIVPVRLGAETIDAALTFCIGEDGRPFDPASPDGKVQF